MIHVRHAAAAIASGLCETVLITHGERGRSGVGRARNVVAPTSRAGRFEQPYGPMGPPTLFTIPMLRYMKRLYPHQRAIGDGLGGAARMGGEEPARHLKAPITVEDVLNSPSSCRMRRHRRLPKFQAAVIAYSPDRRASACSSSSRAVSSS